MPTLHPFRRIGYLPIALAALATAVGSHVNGICDGQVAIIENAEPAGLERLTSRQDHIEAFDREIRSFARLLELPGMVVVVAEDGKVTHQIEWGHADVDAKTSVTVDRLFLIASVTKTFTATLIMQMVDEGLLSLDDPMIDYWYPSFFPMRITPAYRLRHVLGHTAQGTPGKTFVYNGGASALPMVCSRR